MKRTIVFLATLMFVFLITLNMAVNPANAQTMSGCKVTFANPCEKNVKPYETWGYSFANNAELSWSFVNQESTGSALVVPSIGISPLSPITLQPGGLGFRTYKTANASKGSFENQTPVYDPSSPKGVDAVVTTGTAKGSFKVPANREEGIIFNNLGTKGYGITFTPTGGGWSHTSQGALYNQEGLPQGSIDGGKIYPGNPLGALMAIVDGTTNTLPDSKRFSIKPSGKVKFVMNDGRGLYYDNRGDITVEWSYQPDPGS